MAPKSENVSEQIVNLAETINKNLLTSILPSPSSINQLPKWKVLIAGSAAGLIVDTSLYPIDTIKSRLQSRAGFVKSGGLKNLYRGLPPVLAGSIPNAAIFFITYESIKNKLHQYKPFRANGGGHVFNHMLAASCGEVASCIVRVPYEIVKMRSQTNQVSFVEKLSNDITNRPIKDIGKGDRLSAEPKGNMAIVRNVLATEGFAGFYRGFSSTIVRDLPFSALQYPIWERLKLNHLKKHKRPVTASESAYYGSIAGAVAAFITNPLDVAKSRIMLAEKGESLASGKVSLALKQVYKEKGMQGLFAGVVPRVIWISVGAAIFLGSYEKAIKILS